MPPPFLHCPSQMSYAKHTQVKYMCMYSITKHNTQTDTHTHSRSSFCKLMCDLCCLCGHRVLMTGHMSHWPPSSLLSTLPMRQLVSLRRPISWIHPDALEIHKLLLEREAKKRIHTPSQKKYQVLILYTKHQGVTKRPVWVYNHMKICTVWYPNFLWSRSCRKRRVTRIQSARVERWRVLDYVPLCALTV